MQNRILRIPSLCQLVGLSRSTIYRLLKARQFPSPIKIGEKAVGWDIIDIENWIAKKKIEQ
jgi:prophage regulatory protein